MGTVVMNLARQPSDPDQAGAAQGQAQGGLKGQTGAD